MLIDFHTHLFPDAIAGKALARLSGVCGLSPVTDGTVSGTLAKLDDWGVDRAVVLHIATAPKQQANVNGFAAEIDGRRLISFGSVHYASEDALSEVSRLLALGLHGVKLHPDYQGFDADDRRLWPLYDRIAAAGLPLCFHAGFDPLSPSHVHATPQMLARVHREFPSLQIVCAHLGGMNAWDAVEAHLVGQDVFLDTAFIAGAIDPRRAARIIRRHGAERVLFGSDCPWQASSTAFAFIDSLPLSGREKELIFHQNAERLLGL